MSVPRHPVAVEEIVDYLAGDLAAAEEDALEEHLFECLHCAGVLDSVDRLAAAVRDVVRHGALAGTVTGAFIERATDDGLSLREYRIEQGQSVACSGGDWDYVLVRLVADFAGARRLELSAVFENLETGETMPLPVRAIDPDLELGEVLLVFPGSAVRSYPRSRWTLRVEGEAGRATATFGPFVMDHTP